VSRRDYAAIFTVWRQARAFVVDGMVCGDFCIPCPEELAEAEKAEEDDEFSEYEANVSFYIYGEYGLKREYYVDRGMLEKAEAKEHGLTVTYWDGSALDIEPLFQTKQRTETA